MGITIEDLARAGLRETSNGTVVKIQHERATDIRPASTKARQAYIQPDGAGTPAKLERDAGDGAMAAVRLQEQAGRRFLIRLTAVRARLLDEDNLCVKFHVDLLRYASGGAFGDSPATTKIEVCQQKAQAGEREEVRIEVFEV